MRHLRLFRPIPATVLYALLTALGPGQAHATPEIPDPDIYRFDVYTDPAFLGGTVVLWGMAALVVSPTGINNLCDPCSPDNLNPFDRAAVGLHYEEARLPSHLLYLAPFTAWLFLSPTDVGWRRWKTWLTDALVILESASFSGAVTEVFRRAAQRPRPYLFVPGVYPDERGKSEAIYSFYSGHTAAIYDLTTALAFTWTLRHPHSRWRWLVWSSLLLVASASPVLRVLSGDHFPTDVITGALVGTAFGMGWTGLRYVLARRRKPVAISLSASPLDAGGMTASLAGRF